jgi:hypothetical protein
VYFKLSRKTKDFVFLPVPILPGWLKILHLIGKPPKKQKMYQKHIDNFLLHINSESTYNLRRYLD